MMGATASDIIRGMVSATAIGSKTGIMESDGRILSDSGTRRITDIPTVMANAPETSSPKMKSNPKSRTAKPKSNSRQRRDRFGPVALEVVDRTSPVWQLCNIK
jgi:hypothetical protein